MIDTCRGYVHKIKLDINAGFGHNTDMANDGIMEASDMERVDQYVSYVLCKIPCLRKYYHWRVRRTVKAVNNMTTDEREAFVRSLKDGH